MNFKTPKFRNFYLEFSEGRDGAHPTQNFELYRSTILPKLHKFFIGDYHQMLHFREKKKERKKEKFGDFRPHCGVFSLVVSRVRVSCECGKLTVRSNLGQERRLKAVAAPERVSWRLS